MAPKIRLRLGVPNPSFNGRRGTLQLFWQAAMARAVNSNVRFAMGKLPKESNCPHCGKLIRFHELRAVPHQEALKWYQTTPAQKRACPECGGLVQNTMAESGWLLLPMLAILLAVSSLLLGIPLPMWGQDILWVIVLTGLYMASKSAKLVAAKE